MCSSMKPKKFLLPLIASVMISACSDGIDKPNPVEEVIVSAKTPLVISPVGLRGIEAEESLGGELSRFGLFSRKNAGGFKNIFHIYSKEHIGTTLAAIYTGDTGSFPIMIPLGDNLREGLEGLTYNEGGPSFTTIDGRRGNLCLYTIANSSRKKTERNVTAELSQGYYIMKDAFLPSRSWGVRKGHRNYDIPYIVVIDSGTSKESIYHLSSPNVFKDKGRFFFTGACQDNLGRILDGKKLHTVGGYILEDMKESFPVGIKRFKDNYRKSFD